jgi:hypothetical protein
MNAGRARCHIRGTMSTSEVLLVRGVALPSEESAEFWIPWCGCHRGTRSRRASWNGATASSVSCRRAAGRSRRRGFPPPGRGHRPVARLSRCLRCRRRVRTFAPPVAARRGWRNHGQLLAFCLATASRGFRDCARTRHHACHREARRPDASAGPALAHLGGCTGADRCQRRRRPFRSTGCC